MLRHAFARTIPDDIRFPNGTTTYGNQLLTEGIVFVEYAGVIEMFVDPVLEKFQLPEIDNKTVPVGLVTTECDHDGPVVTVYEGAMSVVTMLAMGPWDVRVHFPTGQCAHAVILHFSRTIASILRALASYWVGSMQSAK
jgi:hypothetical protein